MKNLAVYVAFTSLLTVIFLLVNSTSQEKSHFQLEFQALKHNLEMCTQILPGSCLDRVVPKWQSPIRIALVYSDHGEASLPAFNTAVENAISDIRSASGHPIQQTNVNANFQVVLLNPEIIPLIQNDPNMLIGDHNLNAAQSDPHCLGSVGVSANGTIVKATVFIPTSLSGQELQKCVSEEIFGAMGLLGDPDQAASLFESKYYNTSVCTLSGIAPEHLHMLSLHYENPLQKGLFKECY